MQEQAIEWSTRDPLLHVVHTLYPPLELNVGRNAYPHYKVAKAMSSNALYLTYSNELLFVLQTHVGNSIRSADCKRDCYRNKGHYRVTTRRHLSLQRM